MIGKRYRVKLIPKFFQTKVYACSKELIQKYPLYADLHNKEVIVVSKHPDAKSNASYRVSLVAEGDDYWFTLDKKYLIPIIKITTCTCLTKTLMCSGCQCGAFNFEKNKQTKEDTKIQPDPW